MTSEPPIDDEPETDEERKAVEEAREALRKGEVVTHEELKRDLYKPHPDDERQVREAFEAVERGELLSAEESATYLRELLGDELPTEWREHYAALAADWVREKGTLPPSLEALAAWASEPLTDAEAAAIVEGEADFAAGRVLSHADVRKRLGEVINYEELSRDYLRGLFFGWSPPLTFDHACCHPLLMSRPSTLAGKLARMLPPARLVAHPLLADDPIAALAEVAADPAALAILSPPGAHDPAVIAAAVEGLRCQWLVDVDDTEEARLALARIGRPYKLAGGEGRVFASSFTPPDEEEPDYLDDAISRAFGKGVRLCKGSDGERGEERYVFGVVLEPGVVDLQGDTYSAETIRAAAHGFMLAGKASGIMHEVAGAGAVEVVESVVVPDEAGEGWQVGDELLRPGTWLVGMKVLSEPLWQKIKAWPEGGFSIGGSSRSRPADGPTS